MSDKKVWLVTGAGRGLGVDIAKAALAAGHVGVGVGGCPGLSTRYRAVGSALPLQQHPRRRLTSTIAETAESALGGCLELPAAGGP